MTDTILAALRGRDYAAAEKAGRELIQAEPENAEAHHLLSLALRESGDLAGAQAAIERALELAPEHAAYHLSQGMLATLRRDHGAARAALGEAVKHDPNQLPAYVSLAQLALFAGDPEQADQQLRLAERINAEHPHVLTLRGQVLLAQGKESEGMNTLSLAAQHAPDDAMVQGTLGWALMAQKHYAFAEQALRNALAAQPSSRSLRFTLVQSLAAQQRFDEAAKEVDVRLAEAPDDAQALMIKGRLVAARGDFAGAIELLKQAHELRPGHPATLEALVRAWVVSGQAAQAAAFVQELVQRLPTSDAAWSALVELSRRDPQRETAAIMQWLQACPESIAANEQAAQILEAAGDFAAAEACATRVVERVRNRTAAQLVLARTELREGMAAAAVARLEYVQKLQPDPASWRPIAAWLGRARDLTGDVAGAVKIWLLAQRLMAPEMRLPALPEADAGLAARIAQAQAAAPAADPAQGARLLWGAPGSGVEQAAQLLRRGAAVLSDRFGPNMRDDGFRVGLALAEPPADAAQFAQRWREAMEARGNDARDIDWLPHWDPRNLPAQLAAMPGARLLVALRDPRDMLLNWLAFGTPHRVALLDPVRAASWLATALGQLLDVVALAPASFELVHIDRLGAAGDRGLQQLSAFAGIDPVLEPAVLAPLRTGTGGLPTTFGGGHWQRYEGELKDAFSLLEPVAARIAAL